MKDITALTGNPYWEEVLLLPPSPFGWSGDFSPDGWSLSLEAARNGQPMNSVPNREALVRRYSWAIPSPSALEWIVTKLEGRALVEMGAGAGYWAAQLSLLGVKVDAFDLAPTLTGTNAQCDPVAYHRVEPGSVERLVDFPDHALFLCWPPYAQPLAYQALSAYRGDLLVYCGEGDGGCTGDGDFFDLLAKEWVLLEECPTHTSWGGAHDNITLYARKS